MPEPIPARRTCYNAEHHNPHTRDELKADVFAFVENLSLETGVTINLQNVWDKMCYKQGWINE